MNLVWQILKEQLLNLNLIFRLGVHEGTSQYKMHYLGAFWQVLNPFIQIAIYWFIFGFGIRGGAPVDGTPFFLWLIAGLVPWLFISTATTQGSNSVYSKINLVSKMKFPVSVLPAITLVGNSISFIIMLFITIVIMLFYGEFSGVFLLQILYYMFCLYFFLFGLTLLLSTLTIIIRDIQQMVQTIIRIMMYALPILWNIEKFPKLIVHILQLNPFYYIINGFRDALLGGKWFFYDLPYTLYFWFISILILLIASSVHLKFRHKFVDYI